MSEAMTCSIGSVEIGTGRLALIAGPCMAESLELCQTVAQRLKDLCGELDIVAPGNGGVNG